MARSDLLLALAAAARAGDTARINDAILTIAADEDHKRHQRLAEQLRGIASQEAALSPAPEAGAEPSARATLPQRPLASVWLSPENRGALDALLDDYRFAQALKEAGLRPRTRLLLTGAPGNGKTSLAEAVATELRRPLFRVRYESVIGSLLGSTGSELHALFSEASRQESVIFLDEFEVLAKERADANEAGEMKRVVSTLMLLLDSLPSWVIVVAATNHPEMLDRAIWRRFESRLDLSSPTRAERSQFAKHLVDRRGLSGAQRLVRRMSDTDNVSYSWIEAQVLDAHRAEVVATARANDAQPKHGGQGWQTIT